MKPNVDWDVISQFAVIEIQINLRYEFEMRSDVMYLVFGKKGSIVDDLEIVVQLWTHKCESQGVEIIDTKAGESEIEGLVDGSTLLILLL